MKLIVGLGNPGSEYVGTRHNIGWEVLDELAVALNWLAVAKEFERRGRHQFEGISLDGLHGSEKLMLLKPLTYMNASGRSVQAAMAFFQLTPADVMVVLDDLALPAGRIRLRSGGSSGGHNGLRDIERALSTTNYPRLRLGIDSPTHGSGRDYVLGRFDPAQRPKMDAAVKRAATAILTWVDRGIEAAMNQFNADPEPADGNVPPAKP